MCVMGSELGKIGEKTFLIKVLKINAVSSSRQETTQLGFHFSILSCVWLGVTSQMTLGLKCHEILLHWELIRNWTLSS